MKAYFFLYLHYLIILSRMKKIELEIIALSHSISHTHSYAVVLGELNGLRRLPIVIGAFEAQAIAVALERMTPSRPLTHDLMKNFFLAFNVDLIEVVITNLKEGVFFSKLCCTANGETMEIDSRTSDALALAVRFGCPIYIDETILTEFAVVSENENISSEDNPSITKETGNKKDNLKSKSTAELNDLLNEVLENEDYIKAIAIRDELKTRNSK